MGSAGRWEELLETPDEGWRDLLSNEDGHAEDWRALAERGGFPTPAIELSNAAERAIWFDGYVRTYFERDLQDLASISSLPDFRRLMQAACLRLGQLLNQTELGRDVALPQPTVHHWLNLLETSYLLVRLPAYAVNRTKRLNKSPKLHWGDTAVALHLAGAEPQHCHLENLVLNDLLAWRDARVERAELSYWRTTLGEEVDVVIEAGGRLLPIEVKATASPRLADCAHLRSFRAGYGSQARSGLLLHTGTSIDRRTAVPAQATRLADVLEILVFLTLLSGILPLSLGNPIWWLCLADDLVNLAPVLLLAVILLRFSSLFLSPDDHLWDTLVSRTKQLASRWGFVCSLLVPLQLLFLGWLWIDSSNQLKCTAGCRPAPSRAFGRRVAAG